MARLSIYLPDALAREAQAAALDISELTRVAVERALAAPWADAWLEDLEAAPPAIHRPADPCSSIT